MRLRSPVGFVPLMRRNHPPRAAEASERAIAPLAQLRVFSSAAASPPRRTTSQQVHVPRRHGVEARSSGRVMQVLR